MQSLMECCLIYLYKGAKQNSFRQARNLRGGCNNEFAPPPFYIVVWHTFENLDIEFKIF